ncbi:MAG: sulfotransferase [Chloroflexota bacterium]|nr:sulfotransferase [Chloroflexota bacterium]
MLPSKFTLPIPYRWFDFLGDKLDALGVPIVSLDQKSLCRAAEKITRLSDFGDPYYQEGLSVLLHSIEQDAQLRFYGKLVIRIIIINYLTQRLLFVRAMKQTPKNTQGALKEPFIITGLHRSGTTFLLRMLSLDPRHAGIPFWRLFRPFSIPGWLDLRRIRSAVELSILHPIFMNIDTKHIIRGKKPEESAWMMGLTFHSIVYWILAPVSTYTEWLLTVDMTNYYQDYSLLLQAHQQAFPEKSMVLKAPDHTPDVDMLLSVIPNARVIQLHRDPTTCVISLSSLFYSTHGALTEDIQSKRMFEVNKKMVAHFIQANKRARQSMDIDRSIFDIEYESLVADPIGTIKQIYHFFKVPWSDEYEQCLQHFIKSQLQSEHKRHYYTPEQFGQESQELVAFFDALK